MSRVPCKTRVAWFQNIVCFKSDEKTLQKDHFHESFNQKLGNFKAFYRIRIRSESLVDSAESESEYSVDHYFRGPPGLGFEVRGNTQRTLPCEYVFQN